MAHVDLPHDGAGDLAGAGTVFKNRAFVYLWSAQALSQLASNMVLAALMATVRRTTGSDTAVAVLILTFLVPAVLFSSPLRRHGMSTTLPAWRAATSSNARSHFERSRRWVMIGETSSDPDLRSACVRSQVS